MIRTKGSFFLIVYGYALDYSAGYGAGAKIIHDGYVLGRLETLIQHKRFCLIGSIRVGDGDAFLFIHRCRDGGFAAPVRSGNRARPIICAASGDCSRLTKGDHL